MKTTPLSVPEVTLFDPKFLDDDSGFLFEGFKQVRVEEAAGDNVNFVQDHHSKLSRGVLRGLHNQIQQARDKLVGVHPSSPTFGQWVGALLTAENKHQLWIPKGFSHGFVQVVA